MEDGVSSDDGVSAPRPHDPGRRVATVILNWRAATMTLEAVRRVLAQSAASHRVFVVENGSGDGSATALRNGLAAFGDRVTLLVNDRNLGFGGGCNTALREVLAGDFDYCWLLNNDAEPAPSCLAGLLAAASGDPLVGAAGSRIVDPAAPDADHYGSRLDPLKLISHPLHDQAEVERHRFAWLTAASLLVSVPALRRIGLFDERYFMYWEDADLSMRLRAAGHTLLAVPDAPVSHVAGTSSNSMAVQRYLWHFTSQRLWLRKHHPLGAAMLPVLRVKYLLKALIDRDAARFRALLKV